MTHLSLKKNVRVKLIKKSISASGGENIRVDKFLSNHILTMTRTQIKKLFLEGLVQVNKSFVKPGSILKGDEIITFSIPEIDQKFEHIEPEDILLDILFEDESIIAINKPAGLVVHPGAGQKKGTLVNGLKFYFNDLSDINGPIRPGIVHRLDKDTSGVMLIAKLNSAHYSLATQFEKRTIKKEYFGITWGKWKNAQGSMTGNIHRKRTDPTSYEINDKGRESITKYSVIETGEYLSEVIFYPQTGRTHQIRVHSAGNNNPIFGDEKYGGGRNKAKGYIPEVSKRLIKSILDFDRHALHAKKITFVHPESGSELSVDAPIPKDILLLQKQIKLINE